MSAYICQPESFGILAAYAVLTESAVYEWMHHRTNTLPARVNNAQIIAKGLARANIASVAHRYPDDKDGDRPGPGLLDAEIEEAAAIYAAHFITNPEYVRTLSPIQVWKIAQCVDYQSCEKDDWTGSLAWRQLDWIKNQCVRQLPGYDAAEWGYERSIPEIDALYARNES